MAISVKTFINPLNCDEPAYEVPILYHPSSAGEICNGNGTSTNIYGDYSNLGDIASNQTTGNAANSDICQDGMDVVFVVDYTGSMSNAINGVKNGINSIVTEIQSQSNGNYRLGLVLFDGTSSQLQNNYVGQSDFYADLDSTQKINTGNNVITCVEKMNLVGNQSTFATHLSYLATSNGPTGMAIGAGTECGGVATYEVVQNSFAGQWRSNVLKLVILITDDEPSEGYANGNSNGTDPTYFNNTLIPAADANNVQVFSNIAEFTAGQSSSPVNTLLYSSLSNGTTPAGQAYTGLDFTNSTWVNNMISGIATLCVETTTYTCDPAPAGWYTDAPLAAGATIHYWNGSAWVASHNCQYTVRVNLVDNISNGSVDDIAANHPNYHSIDTFTFTGAPGSTHTATIGCSPDAGYANLSLNVSNVSDTNVITNTTINNIQDEVTITVEIPTQDELNHSIQINGSASQIQRTVRVDVINNTNDLTDSTGGTQAVGQVNVVHEIPTIGWLNVSNIYGEDAIRYTFTGVAGDLHGIDVNFLPNPSDYSINVQSITASYFDLSGNSSSTATSLGQTAIANLSLSGSAPFDYTGALQMPAGDVWIKLFVNAQVNEPNYRYTLWVSENITGAQMQPGDNQHIFEGYTGQQFSFESLIQNSPGYTGASATSVSLDTNINFPNNNAITTGPTINSGNTGAEGIVTMPSGGGTGGIIISGQATQIVYSYVITIDHSAFSTASWSTPVTLTGVAGSTPSVVVNSFNTTEYTYNLTGISSSEAALTPSISNATSMAILLDLEGGMPIGGGSATVTLTGTEAQKTYSYDLSIITDNPVLGNFFANPIILTGTLNQVITGSFIFNEVANHTYSATGVTSNTSSASGTLGTGTADLFDVDFSVTMPSGGGSGELTITGATGTPTQHSYTVNYDNGAMFSGNNLTATPQSQTLSGSTNQVIPFTIDLDPSPSYYSITIANANQITTHDGTPAQGAAPELVITGYNQTTNVISGELTMPPGGGSGSVRPKGSVRNPSFNYDVTLVITGSNVSFAIGASSTHTFSNTTGTANSHTFDLVADPGYTYVINNITHNGGAVLSTADNNGDVDVDLLMPNGGGSATVTVSVTATAIIYIGNIVWDEGNSISGAGAWDTSNNQFQGTLNSTHTIDNTWRIQNNTTFYSGSGSSTSISGTNYPAKNPFSNLVSPTPTSGTIARTTADFQMPLGGGTWTFTIGGNTQTTLPAFGCKNDFGNLFNVSAGSVGSNIFWTWNGGPPPMGLNMVLTPSTYQLGSYLYRADFTVPSGYSNAGNTFTCTFTALGTTTTTTRPAFTCADALLYINAGTVGDPVTVLTTSKFHGQTFSIGQCNPTTYQNGTTNYFVDIAISPNATQYSNAGGSIVCLVSGIGTTTTLPLFECSDTSITIPAGTVGDTVVCTIPSKARYTVASVSPTTYQLGNTKYIVTINVPSGYSNSTGTINCEVNGTGTTTTLPLFECSDTNIQIPNGAVGANVLVNMNGVGSAQSVNPSTYQLGQQSYTVTVNVPAGYSNSGGTINCDVSGVGTTTTTTTADPCIPCQTDLHLDIDYYTGPGSIANGVLVAWKQTQSDLCSFDASNVKLWYSSTLNGTYTDLGTPTLYPYNEERTPPSAITGNNAIGHVNTPSYIHHNPSTSNPVQGIGPGYYYITATNNATTGSCPDVVSSTVYMQVQNTTTETSNKFMYLWGVSCDGDASESIDWFGSTGSTARGHVLLKNQGASYNGQPNSPNQYYFTNNSGAPQMPDGDGFNYTDYNGVTKQYWGCLDPNVLRIKVDLNTAAGRAAFDSIGTNQAYHYTGTSLAFNSDLDGKVKFCGIAIPPRQYHPTGQNGGIWNYNNGKLFRLPGSSHQVNNDGARFGATSAPHAGTPNQITEQNATANPAFTPLDWAICDGFVASCSGSSGPDPDPKDPGKGGLSPSPSPGGGGGGGDNQDLSEPGDPENEILE